MSSTSSLNTVLGSHSVAPTVIGVLVGFTVLYVFYSAVRTQWPINYASMVSDYGVVVNRSFPRYLAFALLPTYFVVLLVSTTVARYGGSPEFAAFGIGLLHILRTHGILIYKSFRYNHTALRYPTILYSALSATGIMIVSLVGGLGPGPAQVVVPTIDEFFKAFWTTAFVAIVAAVIIRASSSAHSTKRVIERSRNELGPALIQYARKKAEENGIDPVLVEAILLAENLQRPPWFRTLERLKGLIIPKGSYGAMQLTSHRPLSDRESIDMAVETRLKDVSLPRSKRGFVDYDTLEKVLRSYNPNNIFVDLTSRIFHEIDAMNRA